MVALQPDSEVFLEGLHDDTMQGDREAHRLWSPWVSTVFEANGTRITHRSTPAEWEPLPKNLRHVPDLFQPLAFTLAATGQAAVLTGLDNLRVKETDRLQAVAHAIAHMGGTAAFADGAFAVKSRIAPSGPLRFDPDIDHRMALSLAPLALLCDSITINEPHVVNKSYPAFWDHLQQAGFSAVLNA
jgi:3-phosphoshikimate 1-carboxyvinyltransferase